LETIETIEPFGKGPVKIRYYTWHGKMRYALDTENGPVEITPDNINDIQAAIQRIQDLFQETIETEKKLQSSRQEIVNTISAISWQADNNLRHIIQHIEELAEATKHELYEEDERMAELIDSAIPHF
jgi:predicted transcriptional regulator